MAAAAYARGNLPHSSNKECEEVGVNVGIIQLDETPRTKDVELFMNPSGQFGWKRGRKVSGTVEYLMLFATGTSLIVLEGAEGQTGHDVVYRRVGVARFYERRVAECVQYLKMREVAVV